MKNNKNPEGENFGPRAKRAEKNSTFCGFTRGNRPKTVLFWTKYLKILKSPAQNFLGKWQIIKTPEKNLADFDLKGVVSVAGECVVRWVPHYTIL